MNVTTLRLHSVWQIVLNLNGKIALLSRESIRSRFNFCTFNVFPSFICSLKKKQIKATIFGSQRWIFPRIITWSRFSLFLIRRNLFQMNAFIQTSCHLKATASYWTRPRIWDQLLFTFQSKFSVRAENSY